MIAILVFFASIYLALRVIMVDIINKISVVFNKHEVLRHTKNETNTQMRRPHSTSSMNGHIVNSDYFTNTSLRFRNNRRENDGKGASTFECIDGSQLAPFKSNPNYFDPKLPRERPLMGSSCTRCTTIRPRLTTENDVLLSSLGLANILRVPVHNRDRNVISRSFHYASFVMTRKIDSNFPDVCRKVLKCERVQNAIKEAAEEEFNELQEEEAGTIDAKELILLEEKHKSRAIALLQRMKSCISSSLLRIAGWVLYKLLSRMLTSIQFHKGQIERLRRYRTSANIPIIYLPLHRSHLDYILVSFILYMNNIKPPLVAAGDNLLIPFFGNLMRGLGAFFIKRRLDHKSGKKDHVYRAILHSYMTENLREGNSLEFFIEGGRSRTGKALMPKSGLLSVVVDSVLEGIVDDAFIVPVAISYEKLIDGSFVGEQLGKPKVMESFSLAAKSIWSTLHSVFGSVRVDFCQPFSLKDYLHHAAYDIYNYNNPIGRKPFAQIQNNCSQRPCVACSGVRPVSSFSSLYGLDIVVSEEKRQTIDKLAEHVVYDAFNSTPLMSTQLLAFILLTKHRKGATLHQLAQSLNWLREECVRRKRDTGVSGDSLDVIRYACNLLGKELLSVEKMSMAWSSSTSGLEGENNNVKIVFLKPTVKLPHVLELQYYANTCISLFQLDSIVVNALFAIINVELESLTACGDNNESNITIDYYKLIEKSIQLCHILHNDFIFAPPCTSIRDVISDVIENMLMNGIFVDADKEPKVDQRLRERYREYDFEDEDDDGYIGQNTVLSAKKELRIVLTDDNREQLQFYRSVLSPYIESYWVAAYGLTKLIGIESKEDKAFFSALIETGKEKQHLGLLFHEECIAAEPFKNAIKLFESWNVLEIDSNDSHVKQIRLNPNYNSVEAINDVILRIEEFKK